MKKRSEGTGVDLGSNRKRIYNRWLEEEIGVWNYDVCWRAVRKWGSYNCDYKTKEKEQDRNKNQETNKYS